MHASRPRSGIALVSSQRPMPSQSILPATSKQSSAGAKAVFASPTLSIGSGSFFSAALAVFGSQRISSAVGVELDPAFADAARTCGPMRGLRSCAAISRAVVATGSCPPAPNVILANPPYVRHHHMSREDKERLQASRSR